jgi:hypothetical protein
MALDQEAFALDLIHEIGPGGSYLTTEHTLDHFREFWQPLRGNLMVGVSRNALPERTISFEYLRLEPRADGVYYVTTSMGKTEAAFKLASTKRDGNDETFTFQRGGTEFPTALAYRRGAGGWLYVEVAGQAQGKDHKVTYPFRRVDCESGEFIRK